MNDQAASEDFSAAAPTPFDLGYSAYDRGSGTADNPYGLGTRLRLEWYWGWTAARDAEQGQWT